MTRVFLGLGSNFRREHNLKAAIAGLARILDDLRCSPVFESEAVGSQGKPYLNLVVTGLTALDPRSLVARLKEMEVESGRVAGNRNLLPLDIDLLIYGDRVGDSGGIVLPRPEILTSAHVLLPLSILAPDTLHPVQHKSFARLWQESAFPRELKPVDLDFCAVVRRDRNQKSRMFRLFPGL